MATKIITKAEFIAYREGLHHYFGPELGLPDAPYYDNIWTDSHGILKWKGREDFLDHLSQITSLKLNPKKLDRKLLNEAEKLLIILESEAVGAKEFKGANEREAPANMPTQELLEEAKKKGIFRNDEELKKLKELSDLQVRQAIEQKTKIVEQQKASELQREKVAALQKDLEGKKVYVKVISKEPLPTKTPEVQILEQQAAFPRQFVEVATAQYTKKLDGQNLSPTEKGLIAKRAALTTHKAVTGKSPFAEAAKIQAVASPEVIEKIIEAMPAASVQEAPRPEEVVSSGFTPLRIPVLSSEKPEVAKTKEPLFKDAFQKQVESHDLLRQISRNRFSMEMSQLELYKRFVDTSKIDGVKDLSDLKVEVSMTPKAGFEEVDISRDIIAPHLQTISAQDHLLDTMSLPVEVGSAQVKAQLLQQVGEKLTLEIANLPPDSVIVQAFNSEAVQAGLAYAGITTPATWVAVEGSWMGNVIVGSGYGPVAGFIQSTTGLNFGIIQVLPTAEIGGIAGSATMLGTESALVIGGEMAGTAAAGAATVAGSASSAAVSVAGAAAAGTATAAAGTELAAGAAAAPVTGGVSLAIAAVTAAITAFGPKIKKLLEEHGGKLLVGGLALTAVGFGGGSAALLALGVAGSTAGGAALLSSGVGFGGVFNYLTGIISAIIAGAVVFMGTAFLYWLFLSVFITTLILIIINSGAYIVPPSISTLGMVNPYISVSKTSNPSGQAATVQPVTYTVTITALKDELTGISFSSTCTAVKKNGPQIDCSALEQIPAPPASIPSGTSYTFTFTSNYTPEYMDSLVTDTITVTATAASTGSVSETGTASICFGNCPLDCFNFPPSSWPANNADAQNLKNLLTGAAGALASGYPNFAQKVCAQGTINLCYNPGAVPGADIFAFHSHNSTCDINFNSKLTPYGHEGAMYLLTHEATHHIQNISSSYVTSFQDTVHPTEPSVCTYGGNDPYESMAEGNALFVARPTIMGNGACISNYASQYPKHYDFAKNCMFGTVCP